MKLNDCIRRACHILDEEGFNPTVAYVSRTSMASDSISLDPDRTKPRQILKESQFVFHSKNYDLLVALLHHVPATSRSRFVTEIISRARNSQTFKTMVGKSHPRWHDFVSELPLISEFCIRQNYKKLLFDFLASAPMSPGVLLMLMDLEDIIAFNFHLIPESSYTDVSDSLSKLLDRTVSDRPATYKYIEGREGSRIWESYVYEPIKETCISLKELCRKAQYLLIDGLLSPGINYEFNQDKDAMAGFLKNLNFPAILLESLEKTEELYFSAASKFDLKSSMGHLRSFLESLHIEAAQRVQKKMPSNLSLSRWGDSLRFLRDHALLTKEEEALASAFYGLISHNAVHSLIAEQEYARLMRNITIEYGLLILTKLKKAGY